MILRHDIQIRILDDDFWCGLLSLHEIIAPVVKWITILEGDYCTISLVPKAYSEIKNVFKERLPQSPISVEEGKRIENILEKRAKFLLKPFHFAAHMLDPKFITSNFNPDSPSKEKILTQNEKALGTEMILNQVAYKYGEGSDECVDVAVDLSNFKEQSGIFSKPLLRKGIEKLDALTWWRSNPFDSILSSVASEILTMPASTAATERTFSKYGNIQNNKRNRLKTERAGKLVYLSHNLKLDKEPKNCERKEEKYKEKRLMFFTPCGTKKYLLKLNQLLKTSKMISGSITLTIIT